MHFLHLLILLELYHNDVPLHSMIHSYWISFQKVIALLIASLIILFSVFAIEYILDSPTLYFVIFADVFCILTYLRMFTLEKKIRKLFLLHQDDVVGMTRQLEKT